MADRVVASTDTLNYFRHEFNGSAEDVGDVADILSASGFIASATDVVEAIVLFVSVSVVALPTSVSVAFGIETVLSAVGSTTAKVVS